jgi:uncharacterized membrane protein YkoI
MKKNWIYVLLMAVAFAGATSLAARGEDKEEKEGKEEKIAFAQLPAAVQKTLTDEAKGNKIETVDKESEDGKTIYEADVKIGGKNYEIKVAEDGGLVSKKLDEGNEHKEKEKEEKSK